MRRALGRRHFECPIYLTSKVTRPTICPGADRFFRRELLTRFKGLGEMNAEELRETTLDPANRTLIQVSMRDAGAADDMFRILMGDKVEPRREFIEKHALEVRNLDV